MILIRNWKLRNSTRLLECVIGFLIIVVLLVLSSCQISKSLSSPSEMLDQGKQIPWRRTPLAETQRRTWYQMDLHSDSIPGISLKEAKDFVEMKASSPAVIAIIDSGIDTEHEALNGFAWRNIDEIPANNQDDDSNGYIDDEIGWNYLGEGYYAPLEVTRIAALHKEEPDDTFNNYNESQKERQESINIAKEFHSKKYDYVESRLAKYEPIYNQTGVPPQIKRYIERLWIEKNYHYNLTFDPFRSVDFGDFGNNNILPIDSLEIHGSHVAGIITSIIGHFPKSDIKFMPIRAIPNGDEYDEAVALAIRYAVDNGAKVINLSFGKQFSSNPGVVRNSVRYAEENDVIIVNAAGNTGLNIDSAMVYPNDQLDNGSEITNNYVSVGAHTRFYNELLVPAYSNYGNSNVDIFAPGDDIYSAMPGDRYGYQGGTSMAAPMVSAVAGLLRSYYPELKSSEVKQIILDSGIEVPFNVWIESEGRVLEEVSFKNLSRSGRILNAYKALKMAGHLSGSSAN